MLQLRRIARSVHSRWQTPLKWFDIAIALCIGSGSGLLLIAWCVDAAQFRSNALVEFGAALLTIAFAALAIDWVIAARDRQEGSLVWKECREFALLEARRHIQRLVFAGLKLLPPGAAFVETVHLWDAVSLRNDEQLRSLMGAMRVQLTILLMKHKEYPRDAIDSLLQWRTLHRDSIDQLGLRLMPLMVAAHCPQSLLASLASVLYRVQSMWWSFDGLEYGRDEGRATQGQYDECVGGVSALLSAAEQLHKHICLGLENS